MILADATVPWPTTGAWTLGAIGVLTVYVLLLTAVIATRKLFARRPPMDEQLADMQKSMTQCVKEGDAFLQKQIDDITEQRVEHHAQIERTVRGINSSLEQMRTDLMNAGDRRQDVIQKELQKLSTAVGRLDERTNPKAGPMTI